MQALTSKEMNCQSNGEPYLTEDTPNVGGTETNPDPVVLNFDNVEGQFIRIIGKGAYADGKLTTPLNQHTSIRELQIFGQKGDEVYTYSNQVLVQMR